MSDLFEELVEDVQRYASIEGWGKESTTEYYRAIVIATVLRLADELRKEKVTDE